MSFFKGLIQGTAIFVIGMNLIGVGLWMNGANYSQNFAWQIVSDFFSVELALLGIALVLAVALGAIFLWSLIGEKKDKETSSKHFEVSQFQNQIVHAEFDSHSFVPREECIETKRNMAPPIEPGTPEMPINTHVESKTEIKEPKSLSADELRKKVLFELTGRSQEFENTKKR